MLVGVRRLSLRIWRLRRACSSCLLFPGQGSQYVGMGKALIEAAGSGKQPEVLKLFKTTEKVLGYDLRALFLRGPQEKLDETVHCQPAVVVASLAALEAYKDRNPEVLAKCKASAGFSVGELTALMAAQSLSLEQGLQVVKARALAMQEACVTMPGAMATVIGLQEDALQSIIHSVLQEAKEKEGDSPTLEGISPEVCLGNSLFPGGAVVSGEVELVREVGQRAEVKGASIKPVRVSGAFHSKLMSPAVNRLQEVLKDTHLATPVFPVYSNVTGLPYGSVEEIRTGLALQVTHPVLWADTMRHMIRTHAGSSSSGARLLEVGPGRQLKAMLKRIDRTAYRQCETISV